MTDLQKSSIYEESRAVLDKKLTYFKNQLNRFTAKVEDLRKLIPELIDMRDKVDPGTEEARIAFAKADIRETQNKILGDLIESPYFTKCTIKFDGSDEVHEFFFSKHSWVESGVYSWVTPVSTIRFEKPGRFSYTTPDGNQRTGELFIKENYIITRSEINYLTYENQDQPRQLIYQKHLSERKKFALPEIVAELEKSQDEIIRTAPEGGFLITGSAGSGKTTLALHRIAYLAYSPEFQDFFVPKEMLVFVADNSAINYFSNLLPDLGIEGVKITTFMDWGVDLIENNYHARFKPLYLSDALDQIYATYEGEVDARIVYDELRNYKLLAKDLFTEGMTIEQLFDMYKELVGGKFEKILIEFLEYQWDFNVLDDIDITFLLLPLESPSKRFKHVVVDEVQNWLSPQLDLVQKLIESKYKSISYIGDIKQKTKAFTVASWEELSSGYPIAKTIELSKVYRNTKQVLEWLKAKGFNVDPGTTEKIGPEVTEHSFKQYKDQVDFITMEIPKWKAQNSHVGVLFKYQKTLEFFRHLDLPDHIHLLTIESAQGLEFDIVVLVNAQDLTRGVEYYEAVSYTNASEYAEVDRQLIYVAATRAEQELIVCTVRE